MEWRVSEGGAWVDTQLGEEGQGANWWEEFSPRLRGRLPEMLRSGIGVFW